MCFDLVDHAGYDCLYNLHEIAQADHLSEMDHCIVLVGPQRADYLERTDYLQEKRRYLDIFINYF